PGRAHSAGQRQRQAPRSPPGEARFKEDGRSRRFESLPRRQGRSGGRGVKRRAVTIRRENALAIARAAAFVPAGKRPAFLKGILQSLRGLSRLDADVIAQAV